MASIHATDLILGRILVREKFIEPKDLDQAEEAGVKSDAALLDFLIKEKNVSEHRILEVVARALNFGLYKPEEFAPDESLAKLVPSDFAFKFHVIPVRLEDDELFVAVLGVPSQEALMRLESGFAQEVIPLLASRSDFMTLQRLVYGSDSKLIGVVDDLEEENVAGPGTVEIVDRSEEENITAERIDEAPVIRLVNTVLAEGVRLGASDVHISPERNEVCVRYRRDGLLCNPTRIPSAYGPALASRIKVMGRMDISITRVPQDGRFSVTVDGREINVRVSTLPTVYGENIVMRLLDVSNRRIASLPELGMSAEDYTLVSESASKPNGMILLTGPTGSGKSTSLYAILKQVARPDINVITLEDPVEYRLDGIRQAELNRRAGMTFASGLRAILRQDPDVLMVGEIRDAETAAIAVQAALTGHLVLSTLHTNDAVSAVYRLMDLGIEKFLISSVLLCSIAQRLVRTICPNCKESYRPDPALLAKFGLPAEATYVHGRGCPHCSGTGYSGRMGVYELFPVDDVAREGISGGESMQQLWRKSLERNGHTMASDIAAKIMSGKTTVEEAIRVMLV